MRAWNFCLLVALSASASAHSQPSYEPCFLQAAIRHTVNPDILRAIAAVESNNNPRAVRENTNNTHDYGLMQINSIHLKELGKYGIDQRDLMEPCTSIHVAAWLLSRHMRQYGNSWDAIGAYHSKTDGLRQRYASKVYSNLP